MEGDTVVSGLQAAVDGLPISLRVGSAGDGGRDLIDANALTRLFHLARGAKFGKSVPF